MSFSHQQVRAMISMMTKTQRQDFARSCYREIFRQTHKLEHTNSVWLQSRVRQHFDDNKDLSESKDQIKAIERAAYFMRSNLGGFI